MDSSRCFKKVRQMGRRTESGRPITPPSQHLGLVGGRGGVPDQRKHQLLELRGFTGKSRAGVNEAALIRWQGFAQAHEGGHFLVAGDRVAEDAADLLGQGVEWRVQPTNDAITKY
jgi:hypothetical protein